jgi:hypothetical protein
MLSRNLGDYGRELMGHINKLKELAEQADTFEDLQECHRQCDQVIQFLTCSKSFLNASARLGNPKVDIGPVPKTPQLVDMLRQVKGHDIVDFLSRAFVPFMPQLADMVKQQMNLDNVGKVRRGGRSPNPTEQAVIDYLHKEGFIGLDSLEGKHREKHPTAERIAWPAIGHKCDGQFKATLSHMVDFGWIDNARHHGMSGGYYLNADGAKLATVRPQSGPSQD